MPTFYNFRENGLNYNFDNIFVPAELFQEGNLWIWGNGSLGQLGINDTTDRFTPVTTSLGGTNWKQISPGHFGSVSAIKTDGTLWVWGNASIGKLGTNDTIDKSTPVTTFAGGTDWKQVSSGRNHTSAIKTDGTLWVWGEGGSGRLGTNDGNDKSTPVTTFAGGTNWKQVSAGYRQTLAIKTDGTLWTWGNNFNGELGNNNTTNRSTPVTTRLGGTDWKQVSSRYFHSAAVKTNGTLWTWGGGSYGSLGNNNDDGSLTPVTTSLGGTDWKQVSTGYGFTAAIKTNATLWTWGRNDKYQLGKITEIRTPVTTFAGGNNWADTPTTNPEDLYTISAGSTHSTALKTDGTLWIWGNGISNTLGNNSTTSSSTPVTTFVGGTNWKQVNSGQEFTTAIKTDGTLWTWGNNANAQLGRILIPAFRLTPITTFAGGNNWADTPTTNSEDLYTINAGRTFTAAIKTDGTLWTWGTNSLGQLGTNSITIRSTPVTTFAGGTNWKQLCSGNFYTGAIKTDGTLWTWGNNGLGQLGNNNTSQIFTPVTTFAGGTDWKQVSANTNHLSAIKTDGTLWTWGNNNGGQLGILNTNTIITPVTTLIGGTDWKQTSAGSSHTAAIKTDGTLWAWGNNFYFQLGRISESDFRLTPVTTFAGGNNWADTPTTNPEDLYTISAGYGHSAAIKSDGTLWVWGNANDGRLGTNDQTIRFTPVTTFAGGTNWKQVSAGSSHTAAIKTDGTLWAWGGGGYGQLGTNDTINKSTPVTTFAGGTDWKQVSSNGYGQIAAIKTDGTLWVWGEASNGRLGTNDQTDRITPVTTFAGGTDWKQLSVGSQNIAAIKTDGTLWTWGSGGSGRLGTNDQTTRLTPVTTFAGGTNWKQVTAGLDNTAAIKTDGTLWVWGFEGENGTNDSIRNLTPVTTFAGGTDWKQVSDGAYSHTAAIKTDGTLWIWGLENSGRTGMLGINIINAEALTPVTTFAGGTNWTQVSAGNKHTIALQDDGVNKRLYVFGSTDQQQLGINYFASLIPAQIIENTTDWKQVSAADRHTAAIKTDGTLWVWGNANNGRLGTNDQTIRFTPVTTFAGGTNWKQVAATDLHTTAIKTDGTLWVWGFNNSGRLGTNDTIEKLTPVTTFAGGTNWTQVSAGTQHTVALKETNELYIFGNNSSLELGINYSFDSSVPDETIQNTTDWKQVSSGGNHVSAIKTDGTLWTWGNNGLGQLGDFTVINRSTPVTTFAGGTDWKQVSNNIFHTTAVKTDGTLWTWGNGTLGQLGRLSAFPYIQIPVTTFAGGTNWADTATGAAEELYTLSAAQSHTGAIKTDGTLWVWGNGNFGRLGTNNQNNTFIPVTTFAGGTDWKQLSIGRDHTAAIKIDGTLWTWGNGISGQLGTNNTSTRSTPVTTFAGGTDWKQVSAGSGPTDGESHIAAIKTDGTLWVWGSGANVKLGTNDVTNRSTPVTTFAGGTDWKQISTGRSHTSAIKTDGTLWTWGYNNFGRLGTNNTLSRSTPVTTFAGGTDWKQVDNGELYTTAIKTDGTLWVWGNNVNGQLGTNDAIERSTPVTTFAGGTNWKQVSGGEWTTTAIKTDGTLWTWGNNTLGQLGINDITAIIFTPVTTFAGGTNWKQVSSGWLHTVALQDNGVNKELYVFGSNANLQLGIPYGVNFPEKVEGSTWKQVSSGRNHTAAIKTDGTLWTWGFNNSGRLGTNDENNRFTPVTTFAGGTNWKQVAGGAFHTTAIKTDGTLWTWGEGSNGQLGTIDTIDKFTPVTTFAGGTNWKQVSAGDRHTIALQDDGVNKRLYLFGTNGSGELGNNIVYSSKSTPTQVSGNSVNWKQVSIGRDHSSAIKTDGTLWTWGYNNNGKLGINNNNTTLNRFTPATTFLGGTTWRQVENADNNTAVVTYNDPVL